MARLEGVEMSSAARWVIGAMLSVVLSQVGLLWQGQTKMTQDLDRRTRQLENEIAVLGYQLDYATDQVERRLGRGR
jgi:hypothetical protein